MGQSLTAECQFHRAHLVGLLPGQEAGEGGRSSGLNVNQLTSGCDLDVPQLMSAHLGSPSSLPLSLQLFLHDL